MTGAVESFESRDYMTALFQKCQQEIASPGAPQPRRRGPRCRDDVLAVGAWILSAAEARGAPPSVLRAPMPANAAPLDAELAYSWMPGWMCRNSEAGYERATDSRHKPTASPGPKWTCSTYAMRIVAWLSAIFIASAVLGIGSGLAAVFTPSSNPDPSYLL
jgi:hypothetical protein